MKRTYNSFAKTENKYEITFYYYLTTPSGKIVPVNTIFTVESEDANKAFGIGLNLLKDSIPENSKYEYLGFFIKEIEEESGQKIEYEKECK